MMTRVVSAVIAACFVCGVSTMWAGDIAPSELVVFGDSLSDNGNAFIGSGGTGVPANYAAAVYNGIPVRYFTDGPNTSPATTGPTGLWVDQFAAKLGVADPAPFLSNPVTGTNYAVGSAQTGSNGSFYVGDQVKIFSAATLGSAPSNALYTFWAGADDIFNGKSPITAADNIMTYIEGLKGEGAQNFLWLNLPLLGDTPLGSADSSLLNAASLAFDTEWQTDLNTLHSLGINVIGVNIESLFLDVKADNAAGCAVSAADPLCFANVTSPAQGQNVDPNTYLYWDTEHPTTAADALVADLALSDLQAVPEPKTGETAGAAAALLLGAAVFRRRRKNVVLLPQNPGV